MPFVWFYCLGDPPILNIFFVRLAHAPQFLAEGHVVYESREKGGERILKCKRVKRKLDKLRRADGPLQGKRAEGQNVLSREDHHV